MPLKRNANRVPRRVREWALETVASPARAGGPGEAALQGRRGGPGRREPGLADQVASSTAAAKSGSRISWCPVIANPRAPSAFVGRSTTFTRGR